MRASSALAACAVALALGACTKTNPNYCADAGAYYGYNCAALDAARQEHAEAGETSDAADAADAAEAAEAGDATADGDAAEAMPPVCTMDLDCVGKDAGAACGKTDGGAAACVECTDDTHCTTAGKPVCDKPHQRCVPCTGGDSKDCMGITGKSVCVAATQTCVECVDDSTCAGVTPKCDGNACRACKTDAECPGAGICVASGACATEGQVLYVAFDAGGCPGADGSSGKPFCNPSDAVAALATDAGKSVIVIKGPASGQLSFDTAPPTAVTVVGRKNAGGEAPTIPLGVLTGIRVAAGSVLVRDLAVAGGTGASARGALATGASAALELRRVTIDAGAGLGVQADTSASLTMDQCVVKNSATGGLYVTSLASYAVQNSAFLGNGYGLKVSNAKTSSTFVSNTVVGNAIAATCDAAKLSGSIVLGPLDPSCTLDDSVSATSAFDGSGYHLTMHVQCPAGPPTGAPAYDIDGDARTGTIDCGADEYVAP